jgi:Protein of unknown function (DUF3667)
VIPATCGNCNAPLTGPYCAQCGQHAHESARTLGSLFHDAWHVITHVDSRFWSTLWLLLSRPGQLTLEYFADRRARYAPPVRLYLVISIVFFGLTSLTSRSVPGVAVAIADNKEAAADVAQLKRDVRQAALEAREATERAAPADAARHPTPAAAPAAAAPPGETGPAPAATGAAKDAAAGDGGFDIDIKDCEKVHSSFHWLEGPLKAACRRGVADGGRSVRHAFVANIPKMMFVFLPLIAFLMLLLYWFPRRYYVEHLVFVLHNHAALFLAMVLLTLVGLVARLGTAFEPIVTFGGLAVFFYACWYVYRATRRYYGQGRALTLVKLALVGVAYVVCLLLTLLGTVVVSALTA